MRDVKRRGFFVLLLALAVLLGGLRTRVPSAFIERPLYGISILEGRIASHATLVRGANASVERGRPRDDRDSSAPHLVFPPATKATPGVGPASLARLAHEAPSRKVPPFTTRTVPTARGPPRGGQV